MADTNKEKKDYSQMLADIKAGQSWAEVVPVEELGGFYYFLFQMIKNTEKELQELQGLTEKIEPELKNRDTVLYAGNLTGNISH